MVRRLALSALAFAILLSSCSSKKKKKDDDEDDGSVQSAGQPGSEENGGIILSPDQLAVQEAKDRLTFAVFAAANADMDSIATSFKLPQADPNGTQIRWSSGDRDLIGDNGVVKRPPFGPGNVPVTLSASLVKNRARDTKVFGLTVLETDPTDDQAVAYVEATITELGIKSTNPTLMAITTNLNLPTSGKYDVVVTWTATVPSIAGTGVVTRPSYSETSATGTLTATVTRGTVSRTKEFPVKVLRFLPDLLITEVYSGIFTDSGWVEILNTTAAPIELGGYGWRSCNNTYTCAVELSGTLPAATIASGAYLVIHVRNNQNGEEIDGKTDVYVPSLVLLERNDYFELTKDAASVDFVRWDDASYTMTKTPLTGAFASSVEMLNGDAGTSIGRRYPYDDSDSGADWVYFLKASSGGPNGTGTSPASDTDGDGLSDDYEINISHTDPANADTDGDWFTDGQEVLDDGLAGINLRVLGASPLIRDVFVELDYMASPAGAEDSQTDSLASKYAMPLRRAALDKVAAAFAAYTPGVGAPNPYPIRVHFDVGDLFDQAAGTDPTDYDLGGGGEIAFNRCIYLGTDGTHTASTCANLYALKQDHFLPSRRSVFHYFIFGWSQNPDGTSGSSGVAELPGNDGLITTGSWGGDASFENQIMHEQAATILHELGHNLALRHGGSEDTNYKPSYVSTMNYLYQLAGLDHDDDGDVWYANTPLHPLGVAGLQNDPNAVDTSLFKIGFSGGGRTTLDEAVLDETVGWNTLLAIDFNGDGDKDDVGVQINLQPVDYDPTGDTDVLADHDDWGALDLAFQSYYYSYWHGASRTSRTDGDPAAESDEQPRGPICLTRDQARR